MAFASDISANLPSAFPALPPVVGGLPGISSTQKASKSKVVDARNEIAAQGALLSFDLIRENVEECLLESIRDTTGDLHALMADEEIIDLLRKILGKKGDAATVGRSLREMVAAFSALAEKNGKPETAVLAMSAFTQMLQTMYSRIADLRKIAEGTLNETVEEANTVLAHIAQLNGQIAANAAVGNRDRQALIERDDILARLARSIDFTSFNRSDGSVALFSKKGASLVEGQAAVIAIASPDDTAASGLVSGRRIIAGAAEIGAHFSTGALRALLTSHDRTLPGVQCQLDTLAQTLQSRLNQVSNRAVAGPDARRAYEGTRRFVDPLTQRIGVAGGDTLITLLGPENRTMARTSLTVLMKRFRQASGLPDTPNWPVGQVALALNAWLNEQWGTTGADCAVMTDDARLTVQLPRDKTATLAFRDQRSTVYQSQLSAAPDKALGLKGALKFSDDAGNRMCAAGPGGEIALGDSLNSIVGKLNRVGGLSAGLIPAAGGHALRISSTIASDLTIDPDVAGATSVAGLNLLPAEDLAADDIAINHTLAESAVSIISKPFDHATAVPGAGGILSVADGGGALLVQLTLDPTWSLETLASHLLTQSQGRGFTAALVPVGNRIALKITASSETRVGMPGKPDALMSVPSTAFSAKGGDLRLSLGNRLIGQIKIVPGSDLNRIVGQINEPEAAFGPHGIEAILRVAGAYQAVEIGGGRGEPLQASGSQIGNGPGLLTFHINPRDLLGFSLPPDQAVPGFANFFGLNDVFIADPSTAFDPKVPPGLFNSNAAAGTAQALAVNPRLRDNPHDLGDWNTLNQISDLLSSPVNMAAAGELPRGNQSLVDYADSIVEWATVTAAVLKNDLSFKKVLLEQIENQKNLLPNLTMTDRLENLSAFQQAHEDSTRLLSSMPKLLDSLGLHLH